MAAGRGNADTSISVDIASRADECDAAVEHRSRGDEAAHAHPGAGRDGSSSVIGRLSRSRKYEAVYLHELTGSFEAEWVIGEWIDFYGTERPHSSLDGHTPAEAGFAKAGAESLSQPNKNTIKTSRASWQRP